MRLQLDPGDDEAEQAIRVALERRSTREIQRALDDLLNTLVADFDPQADPYIAQAMHNRFMNDQKLRDSLSRMTQDAADLGVSVAVDTLEGVGFGFDYTLANVQARDWALRHTDDILRQLAGTTQQGVGQAVSRWIDNGEPLSNLVDDLGVYFDKRRAERIAVTEVTRAFAEGNRQAYQESGVVEEWEWSTANDEIVCPICGALNGKRRRMGEPFDRNIVEPPAHPNCRCDVRPVVTEPARV
jgi:SPP1 gp7 family putative phage head morphogenesis protein